MDADARAGSAGRRQGFIRVERPPSLASIVTDQIRELIITGGLKLGEQLSENTLAEQLNVSRTPVREAFMRLASEHLVEVKPQRGTFVFDCDAAGIRAICELREVLETGALRLGYCRNGVELIRQLETINAQGAEASGRSATAYQPLDHAFHQAIVAATENDELVQAYSQVAGRVRALRYRYTRTVEEVQKSQAVHQEMVGHLTRDDIEAAVTVMRAHVYASLHNFERRHGEAPPAAEPEPNS